MRKVGMLFALVAMAAFIVSGLVVGNVLAAGNDTAIMSLRAKSDTFILQNGKVQVGIQMDTFSIVNGEGYDAWQTSLSYSNSLNVQSVEFLGGPGENPLGVREFKDDKANTKLLIGANNLPGEDGSNFKGQLAVVTFVCNSVDKAASVTMGTTLVITDADKDVSPKVNNSFAGIDCRQALMGLAIKGDAAHFVEEETASKLRSHIKVDANNPFTITVNLKDVVKLKDEDQVNDTGGYIEVHTQVAWIGTAVLNATAATVVVPGCTSAAPTAAGKTSPQVAACTTFDAAQSGESKVLGPMIEIRFVCQGAGDVTIFLTGSQAANRLVAEDGSDISTHFSQAVNVECIADSNDKDSDGCRHSGTSPGSEKSLGLDPNFYDYPDDKDDNVIDIQDINNYVNFFGFPPGIDPDGPGPITKLTPLEAAQPIDDALGITDIAQAVSLFGQACQK